jgi:DNA-binding NarL/FixJ family response regulator
LSIRVLVIDDFPLVREGFIAALESHPGIEVIGEAGDAIAGFALAVELRPDVVILDMRMPQGSGTDKLAEVRDQLADTRVLVITASQKPEALLEAISAGADGFLTKRATRAELCEAVMELHNGGTVIPPEMASQVLRRFAPGSRDEAPEQQPALTVREEAVLRLVADGLTDKQIAERLFVSPRTVQSPLAQIRRKTGLARRSALARWVGERMLH